MQRIVSGASTNPRADALQRIAPYYGAPLEWLLTGAGHVPQVLNGEAITEAAWQWWNFVRSLGLPRMMTEELRHLPQTRHDSNRYVLMAPMWATHVGRVDAVQAFMTAGDYREWYYLFVGLLQLLCKEELRKVCADIRN